MSTYVCNHELLLCYRIDPITQCQMWKVALRPDTQTNFDSLLRLCEYEIHLSVQDQDDPDMFQKAGEVLKGRRPEEVDLWLHLARESQQRAADSLGKGLFGSLPNIKTIRFVETIHSLVTNYPTDRASYRATF